MNKIKGVEPKWIFLADTVRDQTEIDRLKGQLAVAWESVKAWERITENQLVELRIQTSELAAARQDVERMRTALTILACDCARAALQGPTSPPPEPS
jgi:hypothetical protein